MYPTRDSMVWIVLLIGSTLTYLATAGDPRQWTYNELIGHLAALFAVISAKLQGSPLQLSFKGQEKQARGESVFVELPKQEPPVTLPPPQGQPPNDQRSTPSGK